MSLSEPLDFSVEDLEVKDVEFLQMRSLKQEALIKVSEPFTEQIPPHVSLLAISNYYGYFVAGTTKGFIYASTKSLREAFNSVDKQSIAPLENSVHIEVPEGHVQHLRITANHFTIIVGIQNGSILLYDARELNQLDRNGSSARPFRTILTENEIKDILPNPEDKPAIMAVLSIDHKVRIINLDGEIVTTFDNEDITCICWSLKGKHLVCGTLSGDLLQIAEDGSLKTKIPPPEEETGHHVQNIFWIERATLLAVYADEPFNDPDHDYNSYIILREDKTKTIYKKMGDPCKGYDNKRDGHYYITSIRNWDTNAKHIIFMANAPSPCIGVIGQDETNNWSVWSLEDTYRAGLPLSKIDDNDTMPIGLALDLTSLENLPPLNPAEDETPIPPVPILIYLNNEGMLGAYHSLNMNAAKFGLKFEGMKTHQIIPAKTSSLAPQATPQVSTPAPQATPPVSTSAPQAIPPVSTPAPQVTPSISTSAPKVIPPISTSAPPISTSLSSGSFGSPSTPLGFGKSFPQASKTNIFGNPQKSGSEGEADTKKSPVENSAIKFGDSTFRNETFSRIGSSGFTGSTPFSSFGNQGFGKLSTGVGATGTTLKEGTQFAPSSGFFSNTVKNETAQLPQRAAGGFFSAPASTASSKPTTVESPLAANTTPQTPPSLMSSSSISFKPPQRPPTQLITKPQSIQTVSKEHQTMAQQFEKAYLELNEELKALHSEVEKTTQLLNGVRKTTGRKSAGDLADPKIWTLGDLRLVMQFTSELLNEANSLKSDGVNAKQEIIKLQSGLMKLKSKTEDSERFLKAKNDPEFAKMVKVRQLGPEHVDNQKRLRKLCEDVRERTKELEDYIIALKENVDNRTTGKKVLKAPSLDPIYRSIRNMNITLNARSHQLDDLRKHLEAISIGTDTEAEAFNLGPSLNAMTGSQYLKGTHKSSSSISIAAKRTAEYLRNERFHGKLKQCLTARQTPIRNNVITQTQSKVPKPSKSSDISSSIKKNTFDSRPMSLRNADGNSAFYKEPVDSGIGSSALSMFARSSRPDEYTIPSRQTQNPFPDSSKAIMPAPPNQHVNQPTSQSSGNNWASSGFKFSQKGGWVCPSCSITNNAQAVKCVACDTDNPKASSNIASLATSFEKGLGFKFGSSSSVPVEPSKEPFKKLPPSSGGFSFPSLVSSTAVKLQPAGDTSPTKISTFPNFTIANRTSSAPPQPESGSSTFSGFKFPLSSSTNTGIQVAKEPSELQNQLSLGPSTTLTMPTQGIKSEANVGDRFREDLDTPEGSDISNVSDGEPVVDIDSEAEIVDFPEDEDEEEGPEDEYEEGEEAKEDEENEVSEAAVKMEKTDEGMKKIEVGNIEPKPEEYEIPLEHEVQKVQETYDTQETQVQEIEQTKTQVQATEQTLVQQAQEIEQIQIEDTQEIEPIQTQQVKEIGQTQAQQSQESNPSSVFSLSTSLSNSLPSLSPPSFGNAFPTAVPPNSGSGNLGFNNDKSVSPNAPTFGQTSGNLAFDKLNTMGGSSVSTFGQPSTFGSGGSVFGQPSSFSANAPTFGQPSALGGVTQGFGQTNSLGGGSVFGQPSTLGSNMSVFGQPSALGSGSGNVFGQKNVGAGPATFGQPSPLGSSMGSGFSSGGGFTSVSQLSASPFAALAQNTNTNVFGQGGVFGSGVQPSNSPSPFATVNQNANTFGQNGGFASAPQSSSPFATLANQNTTNIFEQSSSTTQPSSPFATQGQNTNVFGQGSGFGSGSSPFGTVANNSTNIFGSTQSSSNPQSSAFTQARK